MGINEYLKVGNKIKEARKKKGLTQEQVADLLNMPKSTYANYENNHREPNMETFKQIANVLDVPIDELFISPKYEKMINLFAGKGSLKLENLENEIIPRTIASHFEEDEFTEDEIEDISNYIEFVKSKRKSDWNSMKNTLEILNKESEKDN